VQRGDDRARPDGDFVRTLGRVHPDGIGEVNARLDGGRV
jgi:hypothetical protein